MCSIRVFTKFSGNPYYEPLAWFMIYIYTLNDIKRFSIFKNGIGIECQKSTKKVRDERIMEVNERLKCY